MQFIDNQQQQEEEEEEYCIIIQISHHSYLLFDGFTLVGSVSQIISSRLVVVVVAAVGSFSPASTGCAAAAR